MLGGSLVYGYCKPLNIPQKDKLWNYFVHEHTHICNQAMVTLDVVYRTSPTSVTSWTLWFSSSVLLT